MSTLSQPERRPLEEAAPDRGAPAAGATAPARAWSRDARRRRLLAGADALTIVAVSLALGTTASTGLGTIGLLAASTIGAVIASKLLGRYDRDHRVLWHTTPDEFPATLAWAAIVTFAALVLARGSAEPAPSTGDWALLGGALAVVNLALRAGARQLWRQTTAPERIAIIGSGPMEAVVRRKLAVFPDLHVQLVASVSEQEAFGRGPHARGLEQFGGDIDRILVASTTIDERAVAKLVAHCRTCETKLGLIPPARGMFGTAVVLDHLAELPIIEYNTWHVSRSTMLGKRIVDVAVCGLALPLLAPLLPFVAIAIRRDSPGPVFFRQPRAGRNGRPFTMVKFRTMVVDAEERLGTMIDVEQLAEPMFKLHNDARITRVGAWLRRTSLDEIPQLYNVLRGEMSLVGPRPEQLDLVERYTSDAREIRLAVRPGITGPMQVFGRGALTFEERLAVEREYVENMSLGRDVMILARTFSAVVRARGAY